ncbi:uncharacterized protein BDV14DRAFT_189869 [Aspergillus stella-maris]|uniref:uncharacterized protein n=1 Tax=Aspergillus stella-maris TaxID=1810926 RepID=UPI003CCCC1F0
MNQSTHIIDPDGEVVIILRHANSPFAQPDKAMVAGLVSHALFLKLWDVVQCPAKVFNYSTIPIKEPTPVSAKHLIFALLVFRKMLTGGLVESINYLQNGSIPWQLNLKLLAKVAVLADYYNCRQTVDMLAGTWIKALKKDVPTTYYRDLILWLWFKKATLTAMSCCGNEISNLGLPIPGCIIRLMNIHREEAINNLVQLHVNALLLPRPVAPFPNITYKHLVRKISSFKSPVWYSRHSKAPHTCSSSSLRILIGEFNDYIEGLDLSS